jgi:hypothetical protein
MFATGLSGNSGLGNYLLGVCKDKKKRYRHARAPQPWKCRVLQLKQPIACTSMYLVPMCMYHRSHLASGPVQLSERLQLQLAVLLTASAAEDIHGTDLTPCCKLSTSSLANHLHPPNNHESRQSLPVFIGAPRSRHSFGPSVPRFLDAFYDPCDRAVRLLPSFVPVTTRDKTHRS